MKIVGMMLLVAGTVVVASAGAPITPEIDATSALGAVALISGSLLILKSRRKR